MSVTLVVDADLPFRALEERLAALGFARDPNVRPVTPDFVTGEPELAAWGRPDGDERLTYTFNPVVSLRVIEASGLAAPAVARLAQALPLLDGGAIATLLMDPDPRRVLRGLFAARALSLRALGPAIEPLANHPNATIRNAAQGTLAALRSGPEPDARERALATMRILAEQALPVVAALIGPDAGAAIESLRPRPDDYPRVFQPAIAERVQAAYEELWRTPPSLEGHLAEGTTVRVDAAPAGMLRSDNELSRPFPEGYRALAPHLAPDRVWLVWRYVRPDEEVGTRYDGLVRLDDRWAWFPKPYRVIGPIVAR